ncbi:MAG: DUF1016 N-terminal domain-containing protein [bacterium]
MNIENLIHLFQNTHSELQQKAIRNINAYLVVRNWLFGRYIVEFEQKGEGRAEYGKELLKELSKRLKQSMGRGFSVDNLELFRRFYLLFQDVLNLQQKSETLFRISQKHEKTGKSLDLVTVPPINFSELLFSHFNLSWSHYVVLLSLKSSDARKFYEIESVQNSWSVRELDWHIAVPLEKRFPRATHFA